MYHVQAISHDCCAKYDHRYIKTKKIGQIEYFYVNVFQIIQNILEAIKENPEVDKIMQELNAKNKANNCNHLLPLKMLEKIEQIN
jgi:hypothetical protein